MFVKCCFTIFISRCLSHLQMAFCAQGIVFFLSFFHLYLYINRYVCIYSDTARYFLFHFFYKIYNIHTMRRCLMCFFFVFFLLLYYKIACYYKFSEVRELNAVQFNGGHFKLFHFSTTSSRILSLEQNDDSSTSSSRREKR